MMENNISKHTGCGKTRDILVMLSIYFLVRTKMVLKTTSNAMFCMTKDDLLES